MAFDSNNRDYSIVTDGELATILSYFNQEYILSMVHNSLNSIYTPYMQVLPNLISSYEQDFSSKKDLYDTHIEEIELTRINTYETIIKELCLFFNLNCVVEDHDIYSIAYYMYDFLISNFTVNMINFFTKYIFNECINIYNSLNLVELKRNKDSSTLYSKKVFVNPYIGAIAANIEVVLKNICSYDINIYDIITVVYGNNNISDFLCSILQDKNDYFKNIFVKYALDKNNIANTLTMLKLNIQQNAEITNIKIDIKNEEGDNTDGQI